MDNTFAKKFLMTMAGLFLAVAAFCMGYKAVSPGWYKNIKAEITNQPYARTITVTAEGKVNAQPDIALVDLSVVSQGKTVKAVRVDSNTKMNAVIDAVKKFGVEAKDITSTQYNLYPSYVYPDKQTPRIEGYNLTQEIQVRVRDLDKVEDILDAGIAAGANQVGQLTFDIDDPSGIKKQAREKAFATAKEKALEMAKAAGVNLGRVVTFSENEGGYYPQPVYANYKMEMAMDQSAAGAGIEPGSKELNINVNVTYEIE